MQPEVMTLAEHERTRCEVWTRVMGYHRPVASFNVGKQGEHEQRRFFREPPVADMPAAREPAERPAAVDLSPVGA